MKLTKKFSRTIGSLLRGVLAATAAIIAVAVVLPQATPVELAIIGMIAATSSESKGESK